MKSVALALLLSAPLAGAFLTPHAPARFAQRGFVALRSEPADAAPDAAPEEAAAPVAAAPEPTAEAMAASAAPAPRQGGRKPRGKPLSEFAADMMIEGEASRGFLSFCLLKRYDV